MKRLTGLDAGFLSMETPTSAMHVSGLAIYDPRDHTGGAITIESVREMVRSRLHLAPPFRQRLVQVPFELHFPLWIEDPDFDLDNHIRRVAVPAPGGIRELDELASELNAIQLDRSRPLWELWFIEGLEDGRVATLTKVHHAAIDGASGSEITVALFDLSPEVVEHPVEEPWEPDQVPSDVEMLSYATSSLVRQPIGVFRALRRTIRAALDVRSLSRAPGGSVGPLPFTAPRTSINGAITAARSVATITLSLSDVKRVKNTFGVTVNDVVLALCAGTLRRYFDRLGEQVDGPLLAMVPVSVRADDQREAMGNQVSSMFAPLATDVDDPVERLAAIHDGMSGAKDQHRAIGADTLTNWSEFAAPAVFGRAMRLYARMGLADRHRPIFNLTISNVPGPPFPLYSAGVKLAANYPLGPIMDGAAMNITVMSLEDSLDFGIQACPDVVGDVWSVADGLAEALTELLDAADAAEAAGTKATEPTARTRPARPTTARATTTAAVGTGAATATPLAATPKKRPAKKRAAAAKAPATKRPAEKRTATAKAPTKKRPTTKRTAARRAPAGKRPATKRASS